MPLQLRHNICLVKFDFGFRFLYLLMTCLWGSKRVLVHGLSYLDIICILINVVSQFFHHRCQVCLEEVAVKILNNNFIVTPRLKVVNGRADSDYLALLLFMLLLRLTNVVGNRNQLRRVQIRR